MKDVRKQREKRENLEAKIVLGGLVLAVWAVFLYIVITSGPNLWW